MVIQKNNFNNYDKDIVKYELVIISFIPYKSKFAKSQNFTISKFF